MAILSEIFYNPIFWIFISYTIGASFTQIVLQSKLRNQLINNHFLSNKWTKHIGVLHLGWLIRHSFMRIFNQKLVYKGKLNQEKLSKLHQEMTFAEVGHLLAFFFLLLINGLFIYLKLEFWYIILFFFLNIIFNFYLVLLQQYNKRRIEKLLKIIPSKP